MLKAYEKDKIEFHLFIIWDNGQKYKDQIIDVIKERLPIRLIKDMKWREDEFSSNLRRFYGRNLPENSDKARECGNGVFTLVIVEDSQPIYVPRYTNQGVQVVNAHMFDMKDLFRRIAKSNVIHATNTEREFEHDVTLLLGINRDDLVASDFQIDNSKDEYSTLMGANGWRNIEELFYGLNSTANYVVLRNFENFPDSIQYGKHSDIDILCDNYKTMQLILNGEPTTISKHRVQNKIRVGDSFINVDIRYVGDNYLDKKWEQDILDKRVLRKNGFYTPSDVDYLYSMTYHALIQKSKVSEDYIIRAKQLSISTGEKQIILSDERGSLKSLGEFMQSHRYEYVEPTDSTVAYNFHKVNGKASINRHLHYLKHNLRLRIKACIRRK